MKFHFWFSFSILSDFFKSNSFFFFYRYSGRTRLGNNSLCLFSFLFEQCKKRFRLFLRKIDHDIYFLILSILCICRSLYILYDISTYLYISITINMSNILNVIRIYQLFVDEFRSNLIFFLHY